MATLALPATALAGPQWGVVVQWGSPRPAIDVGYNQGYTRGVRAGENDARRGNRFNFSDESDYRNTDSGYRPDYGPRDSYRFEYRRGFEDGYDAGYR
jgi:hypothetical protein